MSEAKHTRGPWKWYWREEDGEANCGVYQEERPGLARSICRAPRYEQRTQWEANARLIAASPTMHALLEQLAENIDRLGHGSYSLESREGFDAQLFIDQVRGVLKATGEQA